MADEKTFEVYRYIPTNSGEELTTEGVPSEAVAYAACIIGTRTLPPEWDMLRFHDNKSGNLYVIMNGGIWNDDKRN